MGKYISFLHESDLFYNLTAMQLELVDSLCEERVYDQGELVFEENSRETELYLIIHGSVNIIVNPSLVSPRPDDSHEPAIIATLRRGQSFGEVALVDEGVRTASACAAEKRTRLLRIQRARFMLICNSYPELGYRVMFNLASDLALKMRNTDLKIREILLYSKHTKS
jgi:CRP/FNR family transcriptional regulator, cyclic AMP receptor protein